SARWIRWRRRVRPGGQDVLDVVEDELARACRVAGLDRFEHRDVLAGGCRQLPARREAREAEEARLRAQRRDELGEPGVPGVADEGEVEARVGREVGD